MVWYDMNEWMVGQIGCVIWVALDGYTKNGSNEFPLYADGKVKSCCRNTIHLRPQNPTADKIKQEKVHSHTRPKNWTLQRSPLRPNILFPALSSNISLRPLPPNTLQNVRHFRSCSLAPPSSTIVDHEEVHVRLMHDGATRLADETYAWAVAVTDTDAHEKH